MPARASRTSKSSPARASAAAVTTPDPPAPITPTRSPSEVLMAQVSPIADSARAAPGSRSVPECLRSGDAERQIVVDEQEDHERDDHEREDDRGQHQLERRVRSPGLAPAS